MTVILKLAVEYSSRVELVSVLRALRTIRSAYAGDLLKLQEGAMQRGGDIIAQSAILALAKELDTLEGAIRKHWQTLGIHETDAVDIPGIRNPSPPDNKKE